MSSPYWDGLYSREAEPPTGLSEVDRESWLRGKQEAQVAKASFQQPQAPPASPQAPRPSLSARLSRVSLGVNWRRVGLLAGMIVLLAGVGAAFFYGTTGTAGWVLFAAAVVGLVWRLAGPDMASR